MRKKNVKIALISFSIICLIAYIYLLCNVIFNENSYSPMTSDAIVILGHSISETDSTPDEWLLKRLEGALELYEDAYAPMIIVSGGKGANDNIAVADAMAEWFLNNGVEKEKILIEDKSKNTGENLEFTKMIANKNNIKKIIIVTNDFHMYRSMITAKDYFQEVSGYGTVVDVDINKILAYLKEPLSIMKYKGLHMIR